MDVLQHSLGIRRGPTAEVFFKPLVPGCRQIGHRKISVPHGPFQVKPEHHMEVVGDLVGLDPDERRLHHQQRLLHLGRGRVSEGVGKGFLCDRETPLPKIRRAADEVFPQP